MSDTLIQIITITQFIMQYLLLPASFLLTFILPIAVYVINRRYLWFSIPLTMIIELCINWDNFMYYESRGLVILFTLAQAAVMAVFIQLLKYIGAKTKRLITVCDNPHGSSCVDFLYAGLRLHGIVYMLVFCYNK